MIKKFFCLFAAVIMLAVVAGGSPVRACTPAGYTVEFTYDELQYVMPGDSKTELAAILETVGINPNGVITAVESSNDELFTSVIDAEGTWYIEALKAFNSKEWLKVTIDGSMYEMVVTDAVAGEWSKLRGALNGTVTESVEGQLEISSNANVTTIKLLTDFYADSVTNFGVTGKKILDLNGHVINANGKAMQLFVISGGAELILEDSDSSKPHYYTYDKSKQWTYLGDTYDGSYVPYEDMSNATLSSGTTVIKLLGGAVTGASGINRGTAVNIGEGTLVMNAGNFVGNRTEPSPSSPGGAISLNAGSGKAVFIMNNGRICGNSSANCGGGVEIMKNGEFCFKNGIISDNYAICDNGAGVQMNGSGAVFNMSGGKIVRNHAGLTSAGNLLYGCAVLCYEGKFIMTGGEISGNTSEYENDCAVAIPYKATATIGGSARITDNIIGGHAANLYLHSGKVITIGTETDAPSSDMSIGITMASGTGNITGTADTGKFVKHFNSDNASYMTVNEDGLMSLVGIGSYVVKMTHNGTSKGYTTLEEALADLNNLEGTSEKDTVITFLTDEALELPTKNIDQYILKDCTLDLNGKRLIVHTVAGAGTERTLKVGDGTHSNVKVTIKNGTYAAYDKTCTKSAMHVMNGATVTFDNLKLENIISLFCIEGDKPGNVLVVGEHTVFNAGIVASSNLTGALCKLKDGYYNISTSWLSGSGFDKATVSIEGGYFAQN